MAGLICDLVQGRIAFVGYPDTCPVEEDVPGQDAEGVGEKASVVRDAPSGYASCRWSGVGDPDVTARELPDVTPLQGIP